MATQTQTLEDSLTTESFDISETDRTRYSREFATRFPHLLDILDNGSRDDA
jgi:hypothetical protein